MLEVDLHKRLPRIELRARFRLADETLVLFGPSGAGKSLTLKLLAGIETPDAGTLRNGGRVLFDAESGVNVPPQGRRVGYVPQHSALFPHLSVLENVAFPLTGGARRVPAPTRARALELLELVGLAERAAERPGRLSGGQQQRVALARAVAAAPELLLLDEPFAALDAPVRGELRGELRAWQRELRVPMIFVTHDLEEAAVLADRVAVMLDGKLRQLDTVRAVLDTPADRAVAELVQARNIVPGRLTRGPGGAAVRVSFGVALVGPTPLPDGAAVCLVVRPEALRLEPEDDTAGADELRWPGRLAELVDHGARVVALVDVLGARLEASLAPQAVARAGLRPGAAVNVIVAPSALHVVADEG
jgi:ABC-type Fe3+/spermidine/putrescine transport system ATPase subunit